MREKNCRRMKVSRFGPAAGAVFCAALASGFACQRDPMNTLPLAPHRDPSRTLAGCAQAHPAATFGAVQFSAQLSWAPSGDSVGGMYARALDIRSDSASSQRAAP
jgi:hypothetical protein